MRLSECEIIIDEEKFVDSHEAVINGPCAEALKQPYKYRLQKYYEIKNKL